MDLDEVLNRQVAEGLAPGIVALIARGEQVEYAAAGVSDVAAGTPMGRSTLFRIASLTKPMLAATAMLLIEEGLIGLEQPIERWLPELSGPVVLREMGGPPDAVVPPGRPVTVGDLLTSRAGHGFPSDFSLPIVGRIAALHEGPAGQPMMAPDAWLSELARIPMLGQPGEVWLYNTPFDVLGLLIARAAGAPLADVMAGRLFGPLGMGDTGFHAPLATEPRLAGYYRAAAGGGRELVDAPTGLWSAPPVFPSGSGGLVSTLDDCHAFFRMLLSDGGGLLSPDSVRIMTADHLTAAQRAASEAFLEGQGWGFGGSVDVAEIDSWNTPGRYGWVGGTGTCAHIVPAAGLITILLTQQELSGPAAPDAMREFWAYAARPGQS